MAAQGVFAVELGGKWWLILQKAVLPSSKEMFTMPQLEIYGRHRMRTGRGGGSDSQVTRGFLLRHKKHLLPREDISDMGWLQTLFPRAQLLPPAKGELNCFSFTCLNQQTTENQLS